MLWKVRASSPDRPGGLAALAQRCAGAGAEALARRFLAEPEVEPAGLGARVALIERQLMGGDCLNSGCVPSKALLRSAAAVAAVREAGRFGVRGTSTPEIDFGAVMERVREIVETESGTDPSLWNRMAELGWVGLCMPEEHGGVGLDLETLMVVTVLLPGVSTMFPEPFWVFSLKVSTTLLEMEIPVAPRPGLYPVIVGKVFVVTR